MRKETKKNLLSFLLATVLFVLVPVTQVQAAGLTVCGTTDQNKITIYQKWLLDNPKPAPENTAATEKYYKDLSAKEKELGICQPKDVFSGFAKIINTLIGYIGLFVIARIVYTGIMMVVDGGSADALKGHKSALTNAFIGLVIVMAAFLIINSLYTILGVDTAAFSLTLNPFAK